MKNKTFTIKLTPIELVNLCKSIEVALEMEHNTDKPDYQHITILKKIYEELENKKGS